MTPESTKPRRIRVGRIIREDTVIELQDGETEADAMQRCIAVQSDLTWDAYDCEYWSEPYND